MSTRKTKNGWIVETTNTVNGMLEQGGVCGREVLYKTETLERHGIAYDADPDDWDVCDSASNEEWLSHEVNPDRIIKAGNIIE